MAILTFQDFTEAVEKGRLLQFLRDAITKHRRSDACKMAVLADEYDAQRNRTINEVVRYIYTLAGASTEDFTASNNRIASNFFKRLNTQRCTYSLGNGITFDEDGIKEKLGEKFDTDLYQLAYAALEHGMAFGFWNVDRLHVFKLPEFVPIWDETDGTLRAGIRYWSLDWRKKPVMAVLYEEDGYTKYRSQGGKAGLTLEEIEPKRAYRQTVQHTDAGGDEIIGEENYGAGGASRIYDSSRAIPAHRAGISLPAGQRYLLPIVPLYGNRQHQSTLVGMRAAIDSFDLIQSGFANDLTDCAQVYWIISNANGMEDEDVQRFMDRIRLAHIAVGDTEKSNVTAYTQEPPYNAREAYLNRIVASLYRDFGAFDPSGITSRQVTATEINAAYQPMDEEADAFEYQVIEFIQRLLALQGIEDITPQFKRNRISNQSEQIDNVMKIAEYLDEETVLELCPIITTDMIDEIMKRRAAQEAKRFEDEKKKKTPEDEDDTDSDAPEEDEEETGV